MHWFWQLGKPKILLLDAGPPVQIHIEGSKCLEFFKMGSERRRFFNIHGCNLISLKSISNFLFFKKSLVLFDLKQCTIPIMLKAQFILIDICKTYLTMS